MAQTFDLGNVIGPTGPKGDTGPQGPTGPKGDTGPEPSALNSYPVGAVFEVKQSASTADPAALFGGTWTLDTDTYLFTGIKRYWRTA